VVRDAKVQQFIRNHEFLKFCRLIYEIGGKRNRPGG
jgi:hypothetical protein